MQRTPNYNLIQYEDTDKFLKTDINDSFNKIDTAINDMQETINVANNGSTLTAQEVIEARNGENSLKDKINKIDLNISDIYNKLPVLSLDEYESYKTVVTGGYDYSPALNKLISELPDNGGTILIPNKQYGLYSTVTLNKTIILIGCGFSSELKGSGSIVTDSDDTHKLIIENIKLTNTSTNTLVKINKSGGGQFELSKVWFFTQSQNGTLLDIYGCAGAGITSCWFYADALPSNATGIYFHADATIGTMNIQVSNCYFHAINNAIVGTGDITAYYNLAGIRMVNNMIIASDKGVNFTNTDYIIYENGMIDYTNNPVTLTNVNNPKIRNNYLYTNANSKNIIDIGNIGSVTNRSFLDISHNYMWSGATTKGHGIHVYGDGTSISYGLIKDNSIQNLDTGILLEGLNSGTIQQYKIKDNIGKSLSTFIKTNSGVQNCDIENNFADSTTTFIVDGGVGNRVNKDNKFGVKRTNNRGKITGTGDGVKNIWYTAHNLTTTPSWGIASTNLQTPYSVTFDATNIIVTFTTAPTTGTSVVIYWDTQI
jgi:hypothetical protein